MPQELIDEILELLASMELSISEEEQEIENYTSIVKAMFHEELKEEIRFIRHLLNKPEHFKEEFKAQCAERELDLDNNVSFTEASDSPANALYWKIAQMVFEPKTMKEMLALLLPSIKYQLRADVHYTTHKGRQNPEPLLIKEPLTALDKMEPSQEQFSHFSFSKDTLFNVQDLALFPLALQAKLQSQLVEDYPTLDKSLYQHNVNLKGLYQDLVTLHNKGKTPKVALEELMQGLTFGGERMTGPGYASSEATVALARFFTYFSSLDKELQTQLRALTSYNNDLTLGKIIDEEILEGDCVETTATHLHDLLQNNAKNPILNTSPGLSESDLKELYSHYGPKKGLDTKKDKANLQTIPNHLLQKVLDKVELSIDLVVTLLANVPTDFYDSLWATMNFRKPIKIIHSLFTVIEQGGVALEQKQALAEALTKHYDRLNINAPLLFKATATDDLEFFKHICSQYKKPELEEILQKIVGKETLFLYAATYSNSIVEYLFEIYPKSTLKEALKAQGHQRKTIFHTLKNPKLMTIALHCFDEVERFEVLVMQDKYKETALHRRIRKPGVLKAQLDSLPIEDRMKAAFVEDGDGDSLLKISLDHPQSFAVLLESLSEEHRLKLYTYGVEEELWTAETNPKLIQVLINGLPAEESRELLFSIIKDVSTFPGFFNEIKEEERLDFLLTTIGNETVLDFVARKNKKSLQHIISNLSESEQEAVLVGLVEKAIQKQDVELIKSVITPLLEALRLKVLLNTKGYEGSFLHYCLRSKELHSLIPMKVLFREHKEFVFALIESELSQQPLTFGSIFTRIFDSLDADEKLQLLLFKINDLNYLEATIKCLTPFDQIFLFKTKVGDEGNLCQRVVKDNDAKLLEIMIKNLKPDTLLELLQGVTIKRKGFFYYCLTNQALSKVLYHYYPQQQFVEAIGQGKLSLEFCFEIIKQLPLDEQFNVLNLDYKGEGKLFFHLSELSMLKMFITHFGLDKILQLQYEEKNLLQLAVLKDNAPVLELLLEALPENTLLSYLQKFKATEDKTLLQVCLADKTLSHLIPIQRLFKTNHEALFEVLVTEFNQRPENFDHVVGGILGQLKDHEQFKLLFSKTREGKSELNPALKNHRFLEAFFKHLSPFSQQLLLTTKDEANDSLGLQVIQETDTELLELLIKPLKLETILNLLQNTFIKGKTFFHYCLNNQALSKVLYHYYPQNDLVEAIQNRQINDLELCYEIIKHLPPEEQLNALKVTRLLFNAKILTVLEGFINQLGIDKILEIKERNENLLQKAVRNKNTQLLDVLLRTLPENSLLDYLKTFKEGSGSTLLQVCLRNEALLKVVYKLCPQEDLLDEIVLEFIHEPKSFKRLLSQLTEGLYGVTEEQLLFKGLKSLSALEFITQNLPTDSLTKRFEIEEVFEGLIKNLPPQSMHLVLEKVKVSDGKLLIEHLLQHQGLFNLLYKYLEKDYLAVFLFVLSKNSNLFEKLVNFLPPEERLHMACIKRGDEDLLSYTTRKNYGSLQVILRALPLNDIDKALKARDDEGVLFLSKIVNDPDSLALIIKRFPEEITVHEGEPVSRCQKAYDWSMLQNNEGNLLLDEVTKAKSITLLFSQFTPEEQFNALTIKSKKGDCLLFTVKNPKRLKAIVDCLESNTLVNLLEVVDNNGENLLVKAARENNIERITILLGALHKETRLFVLMNTLVQEGTLLQTCLNSVELKHLVPIKLLFKTNPSALYEVMALEFIQNPDIFDSLVKLVYEQLDGELEYQGLFKTFLNNLESINAPKTHDATEEKKPDLLQELKSSIEKARNNFVGHHKNREDKNYQMGYEPGRFSFFRHSEKDIDDASKFYADIFNKTSTAEVIDTLHQLLTTTDNYHTHSFTSFIFFELNKFMEIHHMTPIKPNENGHYSKEKWLVLKDQLEGICKDASVKMEPK